MKKLGKLLLIIIVIIAVVGVFDSMKEEICPGFSWPVDGISEFYSGLRSNMAKIFMDISNYFADDEESTEKTNEEIDVEATKNTGAVTTSSSISSDDIRQEFKDAMDSYEAFFDEYCEFMKKYTESDNSASMLSDYLSYMEKYTDTMTKFSAIEDEELSNAELAYYIDVNARISQKLLEVAQ